MNSLGIVAFPAKPVGYMSTERGENASAPPPTCVLLKDDMKEPGSVVEEVFRYFA